MTNNILIVLFAGLSCLMGRYAQFLDKALLSFDKVYNLFTKPPYCLHKGIHWLAGSFDSYVDRSEFGINSLINGKNLKIAAENPNSIIHSINNNIKLIYAYFANY
jgi:hypothetical protein